MRTAWTWVQLRSWIFGHVAPWPLGLIRLLIAAKALQFGLGLDARWAEFRGKEAIVDPDFVAATIPETMGTAFRLAFFEAHPGMFGAATIVAGGLVLAGIWARVAAIWLWIVAVSFARVTYPLVAPADEALISLLSWVVLLPSAGALALLPRKIEARPLHAARAQVVCLIALLLPSAWRVPWEERAAVGCVLLLAIFALFCPARAPSAQRTTLDVAAVASAILAMLWPLHLVFTLLALPGSAHAIARIAWTAGVRVGALAEDPVRVITTLRSSGELRLDEVLPWRTLPEPGRVWSYLSRVSRPLAEHDWQILRVRAALRQGVADRACARLGESDVLDVWADAAHTDEAILSFSCRAGVGRLVPRQVAGAAPGGLAELWPLFAGGRKQSFEAGLVSTLHKERVISEYLKYSHANARGAPVYELVRIAEMRMAAREFDEAILLLETASRSATPRQRALGRLDELLRLVRRRERELRGMSDTQTGAPLSSPEARSWPPPSSRRAPRGSSRARRARPAWRNPGSRHARSAPRRSQLLAPDRNTVDWVLRG